MYRLVLYGLSVVAAVAVFYGFDGQLPYEGTALLVSAALLVAVCYVTNKLLAKAWGAKVNSESSLITALILFFIFSPPTDSKKLALLLAAGVLAIASKYLIAWHRKHIANPAAIAAVLVGLLGLGHATWWIASSVMLPFTLLLGLLVARKIRRMQMVAIFTAVAFLAMMFVAQLQHNDLSVIAGQAFTSWPLIFMGTIMLTEPLTLAPRKWQQYVYAVLVGVLFSSQIKLGPLSSTPEVALVAGNIFSFMVGQKYQLLLRYKGKTQLAPTIYDFSFEPERNVHFTPGQYAEWTLPHKHGDQRGVRRTFSIASSPNNSEVHIGIRVFDRSSSFKKQLLAMKPGDTIIAGQFAGNFVLPNNAKKKLVLIAGGIGITPYLSMLHYLADTHQNRDIVLIHLVNTPQDIGYTEDMKRFERHGIKVIPIVRDAASEYSGMTGVLDEPALMKAVPDYKERMFYISGPQGMVTFYRHFLRKLKISRRNIITDHFSGY
jgi:ferredoxin-NADP reductase